MTWRATWDAAVAIACNSVAARHLACLAGRPFAGLPRLPALRAAEGLKTPERPGTSFHGLLAALQGPDRSITGLVVRLLGDGPKPGEVPLLLAVRTLGSRFGGAALVSAPPGAAADAAELVVGFDAALVRACATVDRAVWMVPDAGTMADAALPAGIRRVLLRCQGGDPSFGDAVLVQAAARRLGAQGRRVKVVGTEPQGG